MERQIQWNFLFSTKHIISLHATWTVYMTCNHNRYNEAKARMKVTGRMLAEKVLIYQYGSR